MKRSVLAFAALLVASAGACDVDTIPHGLRPTPKGPGPTVKFDLTKRPTPELPLPNDVGTFADPTSRTGRRLNPSVVASTAFERRAREDFGDREGWGTSMPITVAFERQEGADPRAPAIDLDDVARRMQGHDFDLSDDPIYVVDLTTGRPVFLDAGNGMYPVVMRDPFRYMPNDPKTNESNLSFETVEEGPGLPQSAYTPSLDKDFDGVLDHPNTLGTRGIPGVDDLLTWYERETDTLIVRPIVPLEEKHEYAVVLTDRLHGPSGKAVRSPFDAVHHPEQRAGVQRLADVLADKRLANWYGDIAGTGLEHVAFAWTFTTQPTHEDLKLLRDGLYGHGPFARFASDFPPDLTAARVGGSSPDEPQPAGWQTSSAACIERAKRPFVLDPNAADVKATLRDILGQLFGLDPGNLRAVETALANVDHVVVGTFVSPFLLGDPASKDPDARFHVDFKTGEGDVRKDVVQFFLAIPKTTTTAINVRKAPFPVAFWGHGVTGHADEILFYAGDYARQGIALFAYNQPGHGLVLGDGDRSLAAGALSNDCIVPLLSAIENGRAHDLDGDGRGDSGRYWWSAHVGHTRDNIRQGTLDGMQALRILRSLDGRVGAQDYDGDGKPDILGDFDHDGVVDAGGPNVPYFSAGESLGGVMSALAGGIEPRFVASAPMSGGGALAMDVAFRSYGVAEAVVSQLLGPIVFAVPAGERTDATDKERMGSRCQGNQRSLRIVVNQHISDQEMEIACLAENELAEKMTVVVTNVTNGESRCARTSDGGRFRVPIPTSTGDRLDVQIYTAPDAVESYDGCKVLPSAPIGRRISTWEQAVLTPYDVADPTTAKCDEPAGCQQFRDTFFPVGSALVAPNDGLGLRRQSPELRRYRDLAQAAFDPADPINFAPYYMLKPQVDEDGKAVPPRALLVIDTVGDNFVPVSSAFTFARAAGALPFLPPTAAARYPEAADYATPREIYERLGRKTPMQFLIDNGVVEGIPRLGRTHAGPACGPNYRPDQQLCTEKKTIDPTSCARALYDADWTSEGGLPFDQPHPDVPLRLARIATRRATDETSLASSWEPRLRGVPFARDDSAWSATERVVGLLSQYLVPEGKHTWDVGDACAKWDAATYGNALIARFFATEGRDVYYLSHPKSHACLATGTCDFFR